MFKGIEGLRGYLAWAVVVAHIVMISGLPSKLDSLRHIVRLGNDAVTGLPTGVGPGELTPP